MKQILINILLSALICLLILCLYHRYYSTKTAYVEINKVFNSFQMKAELEAKYKQTQKGRDRVLDSLAGNLKIMSKHLTQQKIAKADIKKDELYQFEYSREEYLKLKSRYEEDNAALSRQYDNQILAQMTQYVIEFGKKNNYDIILGADGNGSLMYAKDAYNLSDEVILFINNKYKGVD